jgi:hypothetical protein
MYQIHAGNTLIWSAPWNPIWTNIHDLLLLLGTTFPQPATVSDLWIPGTRSWNLQLLSNTFTDQATQTIVSTQPIQNDQEDILRWIPAKMDFVPLKLSTTTCPLIKSLICHPWFQEY